MPELYRYAAFISYSSKDAAFAKRLHRALERYGIPSSLGKFDLIGGGKKNRIYPVFRDREELSAGQLADQIEANLKSSAALIVVCSPSGAGSPWVQKEIEFFADQGRHKKIFAIIPDTAPLTDEQGRDATQSCFPPALRGDALSGDKLEPLAADARKGRDGFRNAWLKIVAGMIGVSPGQISDRDARRRRGRAAALSGLTVLVMLAIGLIYSQRAVLEAAVTSWSRYRPQVDSTEALVEAPAGATFQDCRDGSTDCPLMVVLPGGDFMMGSPDGDEEAWPNEFPRHRVAVDRVAVSAHEINYDQWRACVAAGGCRTNPNPDNLIEQRRVDGARPVFNVSWHDAQEYVAWLSLMTGQDYRLLTEAEWEYAARGVTSADALHARFWWGNDDPTCSLENPGQPNAVMDCDETGIPAAVGSSVANPFGLFDMNGNVSEWVENCYTANYAEDEVSPESCDIRTRRGGSWREFEERYFRSAYRFGNASTIRGTTIGFRVARTIN